MTTTDEYWTVYTNDKGTLSASYAIGGPTGLNRVSQGGNVTIRLEFTTDFLIVESGETYTVKSGTTEIFTYTDVKENGQLIVEENGQLIRTGGDNIQELQIYDDHAGSYQTTQSIDQTVSYTEFLPDNIDVSSLVIGIEPSQKLKDRGIRGCWGLLDSATDVRTMGLTTNQFELSVTVLGQYSDFTDIDDVITQLKT